VCVRRSKPRCGYVRAEEKIHITPPAARRARQSFLFVFAAFISFRAQISHVPITADKTAEEQERVRDEENRQPPRAHSTAC